MLIKKKKEAYYPIKLNLTYVKCYISERQKWRPSKNSAHGSCKIEQNSLIATCVSVHEFQTLYGTRQKNVSVNLSSWLDQRPAISSHVTQMRIIQTDCADVYILLLLPQMCTKNTLISRKHHNFLSLFCGNCPWNKRANYVSTWIILIYGSHKSSNPVT